MLNVRVGHNPRRCTLLCGDPVIAFPSMLVDPAEAAGIAVPPDPDSFDEEEFPHFHVFIAIQLGRPVLCPNDVWSNAEVIAQLDRERIRQVTRKDLEALDLR